MTRETRLGRLTLIKIALNIIGRALCAVLIMADTVGAVTLNITTEFKADVKNPGHNEFKNTTPVSGLCKSIPDKCSKEEVSILIPELQADKTFQFASPVDARKYPWMKLDAREKDVVLTNSQTGIQTTARFRWAFIGVNYRGKKVGFAMRGASTPEGDCSPGGALAIPDIYYLGWKANNKISICYKRLYQNVSDGTVKITDFSLGYTLKTDKPLNLPAGEYVGEVIYSVGNGADVDFAAESYTDSEVRILIRAIVEHAFYIKFPSDDTMNVTLTPPSGWGSWINGRVTPRKLSGEVPFILTSSGSFKLTMRCEHIEGTGCGLKKDGSDEIVPLDVSITVPGFSSAGQRVRGLRLSNVAALVIDPPGYFAVDLRSKLDFEVGQSGVERMIKAPGSDWKGVVTLVFDSDIR